MPEMAWKKKGIPSRAPTGIPNAVAGGNACNDLAVWGLDQTMPGGVGKTQNARNSGRWQEVASRRSGLQGALSKVHEPKLSVKTQVGVLGAFDQLQTPEAFDLAEHRVPPDIGGGGRASRPTRLLAEQAASRAGWKMTGQVWVKLRRAGEMVAVMGVAAEQEVVLTVEQAMDGSAAEQDSDDESRASDGC
ncbi:hypothetical protein Dimus_000540 [Dionaea muscipula]